MIPREGLCCGEDGKPQRVRIISQRGFRIAPPFFLSKMVGGTNGLAALQGCFFSICVKIHRGLWISTERWFDVVRQEQIERQKTNPWTYRKSKWEGVKVVVLPHTEPDGLVMDSNTAIVIEKKKGEISGMDAVPGAVVVRGGRPIDCDYAALARHIGHEGARECFKKHNREIYP